MGRVFHVINCLPIYRSAGGVLPTHASHDLDYLQWFFGPVDWVMGRSDTLAHNVEVEDTVSATLRFENGALVSFTGTIAALASKAPRFEIFGEEGVLALVGAAKERSLVQNTILEEVKKRLIACITSYFPSPDSCSPKLTHWSQRRH